MEEYRSAFSRKPVLVENLPRIFESCHLTYQVVEREDKLVLEMQPVFSEVMLPSDLDAILVLASHNGIQQQMILKQSKWVTCYSYDGDWYDEDYGCSEQRIGFDIIVDLNPDGVTTLKKGTKFVHDNLLNLWENKTLSDVTFTCQGKNFAAHTNILASGSPALYAMFQNDFKEKRERIVEITDFDPHIVENLLRYLYTGEIFEGNNGPANIDVENLFAAADKYAIDSLKEECEVHLSRNLTVDNMTRYLVLAHRHNSSKLTESTLDFMAENATTVFSRSRKTDWMEIMKSHPELAFQAMQRLVVGDRKKRVVKLKPLRKRLVNKWHVISSEFD
jgi:hypothetical protein